MEFVLGWVIFSGLASFYASKLNRSAFGYFLLSLFVTPLVTFVFLLIAGEYKVETQKKRYQQHSRVEIMTSDYDKVLDKALKYYESYYLYPSKYNTDDDDEKVFKNDDDQYFVIKRVNENIVLESFNLPAFKDTKPEIIEVENTEQKRSHVDDLVKISELFEKGHLTKEEFEAQKAKIINS